MPNKAVEEKEKTPAGDFRKPGETKVLGSEWQGTEAWPQTPQCFHLCQSSAKGHGKHFIHAGAVPEMHTQVFRVFGLKQFAWEENRLKT